MKQLSIFGSVTTQEHNTWLLCVDGAARNNPGPAGAGIYLKTADLQEFKYGYYLGSKTNNQAEYIALILGLLYARKHMHAQDKLIIKSDSLLLVKQIENNYKIKNLELIKLHRQAHLLLKHIDYRIEHVLRSENKVADSLANKGIDEKITIPDEFLVYIPGFTSA